MASQDEIDVAFLSFRQEWNRAEKAIKQAEQVHGEIINPAIYELRYGGRRIVEAFDLIAEDDTDKALARLHDAHFDCCRARHDAIDAATSKIAAQMDNAQTRIGVDILLANFSELPDLVHHLGEVRDKIAVSRENRDDRDKIYASIQEDNLDTIIAIYNKFLSSEPLLRATAKKARREKVWSRIFGWGGLAIGIFGLLLSISCS